jgi:cytochrome c553
MNWIISLCAGFFALLLCSPAFSQSAIIQPVPDWAYPKSGQARSVPSEQDQMRTYAVPGSTIRLTKAQINNTKIVPDWFPQAHGPAPAWVLDIGDGSIYACGYCHLAGGVGRVENSAIAGLPADYIIRQVALAKTAGRKMPVDYWNPPALMTKAVETLTDAQIAEAARYFAAQTYRRPIKIMEAKTIPHVEQIKRVWVKTPGPDEALGDRIIEGPEDFDLFELRDPYLAYFAYVPPGSVQRGQALTNRPQNGPSQKCVICHGVGLKGGNDLPGPPLAGRSPTYIFRQLYAFQTGARADDQSAPMTELSKGLSQNDMIGLAAYIGSLTP